MQPAAGISHQSTGGSWRFPKTQELLARWRMVPLSSFPGTEGSWHREETPFRDPPHRAQVWHQDGCTARCPLPRHWLAARYWHQV